jgi:hypothetical protein
VVEALGVVASGVVVLVRTLREGVTARAVSFQNTSKKPLPS